MSSNLEKAFLRAAFDGHVTKLRAILKWTKVNINVTDIIVGRTALFLATEMNHLTCVRFLLKQGADSTICNNYGESPLLAAVSPSQHRRGRIVKRNNLLVKLLIQAAPRMVNVPSHLGRTPLMWAALAKNITAINYLLANKADILAEDCHGTVLHYASAQDKNFTVIQKLIKSGLPVDYKSLAFPYTPLTSAVVNGAVSNIRNLVLLAKANIHFKSAHNASLTHMAAQSNKPDALELLFALGLPSDLRDDYGLHCFHYAAVNHSDDCVLRLLEIRRNLTKLSLPIDVFGMTPIHYLAEGIGCSAQHPSESNKPEADFKTLKLLIEKANPNLNGRSHTGDTALHFASKYDRLKIVQLLVFNDADYTVRNNDNIFAFDLANKGTKTYKFFLGDSDQE